MDEPGTLKQMLSGLGAKQGSTVVVDAGIATEENLEWLKSQSYQYICVARGKPTRTLTLAQNPKFDTWLRARTPMARWGDPEELVGSAIFLASPAASFITGQILYVDGCVLATI